MMKKVALLLQDPNLFEEILGSICDISTCTDLGDVNLDEYDFLIVDKEKDLKQLFQTIGNKKHACKVISIGMDLFVHEHWSKFLAIAGVVNFPKSELSKMEIHQLKNLVGGKFSAHLSDYLDSQTPDIKVIESKVTHWGRIGYYFDQVTLQAFEAKVEASSVRAFLDLFTAFLIDSVHHHDDILPIEIETARLSKSFHLMLGLQLNKDEASILFEQFYISYQCEMWPKSLLLWTETFSAFYCEEVRRIIFVVGWSKDFSKLDKAYPSVLFDLASNSEGNVDWGYDSEQLDGKDLLEFEKKFDSVQFQKKKNTISETLFSHSDESDIVSDLFEDDPVKIISALDMIEEESRVKGSDLDEEEIKATLVKGGLPVQDDDIAFISSKMEDIKEKPVRLKALKKLAKDQEEIVKVRSEAQDELKNMLSSSLADEFVSKLKAGNEEEDIATRVAGYIDKAKENLRVSGKADEIEKSEYIFAKIRSSVKDDKIDTVKISGAFSELVEKTDMMKFSSSNKDEQAKEIAIKVSSFVGLDSDDGEKLAIKTLGAAKKIQSDIIAEKILANEQAEKLEVQDIKVESIEEKINNGEKLNSDELNFIKKSTSEAGEFKKEVSKIKRKYHKFQEAAQQDNNFLRKEIDEKQIELKKREVKIKGLENNLNNLKNEQKLDDANEKKIQDRLKNAEIEKQAIKRELEQLKQHTKKQDKAIERQDEIIENSDEKQQSEQNQFYDEINKYKTKSIDLQKQLQDEKIKSQREVAQLKKELIDSRNQLLQRDALVQKLSSEKAADNTSAVPGSQNGQAGVIQKKYDQLDTNFKKVQKDYAKALLDVNDTKKELVTAKKTATTLENKIKLLEKEVEKLQKQQKSDKKSAA